MKRGFAFITILLFSVGVFAGVRRVATSCSVSRFVCYYQQVSSAPAPPAFWQRVAASVVLTQASNKQELALY